MPKVCTMNSVPPSVAGPVRLTLDLARLRGDPGDFPYSTSLLGGVFAACVALDMLTARSLGQTDNLLAHALIGESVVLALCWIALRIRGLSHRYVQTATALVACSLLVTLAQYPLALMFTPTVAVTVPAATPAPPDPLQVVISLGFLALLAWQTLINAHIMRHAMQATYSFALTLVVTWVIASLAIEQILIGAA
jgi:hypothetical protein